MKIPNIVIEKMRKTFTMERYERAVYFAAWFHEPKHLLELSTVSRIHRDAVSQACKNLSRIGWMEMTPAGGKLCPTSIIPYECQEVMGRELRDNFAMVADKAQYLANKRLDLCLKSDEYVLNASPPFLSHPTDRRRLEYSRYCPAARLAIDFDFDWHWETATYLNSTAYRIKTYDALIREGLSSKHGVTHVVLDIEDLNPGVLERRLSEKVPDLIRRHIDLKGPYARTLIELCCGCIDEISRRAQEEAASEPTEQLEDEPAHGPNLTRMNNIERL